MFKKRRRKPRKSFSQRMFRSVTAVIILTAFILGISILVKQASVFDPNKAVNVSRPLLVRLGISPDDVGEVAGTLTSRIFNTNIAPSKDFQDSQNGDLTGDGNSKLSDVRIPDGIASTKELDFKIALLSDSHNNDENLKKALEIAKENEVKAVLFLGDFTDLGIVDNLKKAKNIMDESNIEYYALPGDRDLYASTGPDNFIEVFGGIGPNPSSP